MSMSREYFEPEIFAALCAVELDDQYSSLSMGTWTTGTGTGSDVDDS